MPRRVTTRDIDQCFLGTDGIAHYRLKETQKGHFTLEYILDPNAMLPNPIAQVLGRLSILLEPMERIESRQVNFLLPESSGKFVLCYPFK